jgi:hypothetical protein
MANTDLTPTVRRLLSAWSAGDAPRVTRTLEELATLVGAETVTPSPLVLLPRRFAQTLAGAFEVLTAPGCYDVRCRDLWGAAQALIEVREAVSDAQK